MFTDRYSFYFGFPSVLRPFVVGVSNFRPTIWGSFSTTKHLPSVHTALPVFTGNVIVTFILQRGSTHGYSFAISESSLCFCCCRQELLGDDLNFLLVEGDNKTSFECRDCVRRPRSDSFLRLVLFDSCIYFQFLQQTVRKLGSSKIVRILSPHTVGLLAFGASKH